MVFCSLTNSSGVSILCDKSLFLGNVSIGGRGLYVKGMWNVANFP